jgi:hypothetical protein
MIKVDERLSKAFSFIDCHTLHVVLFKVIKLLNIDKLVRLVRLTFYKACSIQFIYFAGIYRNQAFPEMSGFSSIAKLHLQKMLFI